MEYDKPKFEELISASPLFQLDRETESIAYRRERYKMIEYLYCYLLAVNSRDNEPYGCEIYEVAARCIDNYDPDKGVFLYYFLSAWKLEYRHLCGDVALEAKYHGYRISEEDKRSLKRCFRYMETTDPSLPFDVLCRKFAKKNGLTTGEAIRIAVMAGVHMAGNEITDSEGNVTSIFDQFPGAEDVEANTMAACSLNEMLNAVERAFQNLQERQRTVISDMMTARICPVIVEQKLDYGGFSFVNEEMVLRFLNTGSVPTQREIAEKIGRNEASVSRSVREFLKKLRVEINQ